MTSQHAPGREIVFRRIALVLLALLLSCGGRLVQDPLEPVGKFGSVIQLTIQNNRFNDATIYAEWSGIGRRWVGRVTGKTSETFMFDWKSHSVTIEADFIAGGTFATTEIEVYGGDHLDLVIMNDDGRNAPPGDG